MTYRIYSVIGRSFALSRMTTNDYINPMKFCVIHVHVLPFLNIPKDLDPSYKTYLDCWDCFVRKKLCLIAKEIWYRNFISDQNVHF